MKKKYLDCKDLWSDLVNIHQLARVISPDDNCFRFLQPAQLIKHILGLKQECGKEGSRLLYLWFNVPGEEGYIHRQEVKAFTKVARSDGIMFHSLTYQELIARLARDYRNEHPAYIKYLTERYL